MLVQSGEREWIGLPGRVQVDSAGTVRRGDRSKLLYQPVLNLQTEPHTSASRRSSLLAKRQETA
jgi:hypothetical protein